MIIGLPGFPGQIIVVDVSPLEIKTSPKGASSSTSTLTFSLLFFASYLPSFPGCVARPLKLKKRHAVPQAFLNFPTSWLPSFPLFAAGV